MNDRDDLEDRLRATLHDRAHTVPRSQRPRADLDVRLVRRDRRRPFLMVAAAAVVIGAVAVPVVVTHRDEPVRQTPAATPPPPKWVELTQVTENGVDEQVGLSVDPDDKGWCISVRTAGAKPAPNACYGVPVWGDEVVPSRYITAVGVLGPVQGGGSTGSMLFVTAPRVDSLVVLGKDGVAGEVREVLRRPGAVYFFVRFAEGPMTSVHATARDRKGKQVDSGNF
jgi:hypothetical protein